ncbi:MAG: hypothetical protein ABL986_20100 [Vicinamibacterales bacterium]
MKLVRICLAAAALVWLTVVATAAQSPVASPPADVVARLAQRLQAGETTLLFDGPTGYLRSVLGQLGINEDSQMLVFSKTSLDAPYVSPRTPRAIYFNDTAVVALTAGAPEIEFAAVGPRAGLSFYSLDVREAAQPRVEQRGDCGGCHQGVTTPNVLSLVMMSLPTRPDGSTFDTLPFEYVDQRTPFDLRWGGWYVTGTHGAQRHRGNAFTVDAAAALAGTSPVAPNSQNQTTIDGRFDRSRYLAGTSDIVALMTFEHQARVTNTMLASIRAARTLAAPLAAGSRPPTNPASAPAAVLARAIDELVAAVLSTDAESLREPVQGVSTFARTFPAAGPRDGQGRSLRDFDLTRRVFRYPVSYMIYSELFDGLPDVVREAVYRRVYDQLTAVAPSPGLARVSAPDRLAALEIIRETKPGLPSYWMASGAGR